MCIWNVHETTMLSSYIYQIQTTLCANCESIPHTACQRALYKSQVTTVGLQKSTLPPPHQRKKEKRKITWNTLSHEWLTCSDTFTSRSCDYLIENKTCRCGYLPENKCSTCSTTLNSVTRTGSIVCIYIDSMYARKRNPPARIPDEHKRSIKKIFKKKNLLKL